MNCKVSMNRCSLRSLHSRRPQRHPSRPQVSRPSTVRAVCAHHPTSSKLNSGKDTTFAITPESVECHWHLRARQGLASLAAAATVLTSFAGSAPATEITFKASNRPDVLNVQMALVETWGIVSETFVDGTFNNHDWDDALIGGIAQTAKVATAEEAYGALQDMVGLLGDPFTRVVRPSEYKDFKKSSEGELMGVGIVVGVTESSNDLVVLGLLRSSPAERAGVMPGDIVEQIGNKRAKGITIDKVSDLLRGKEGTLVQMKLRRAVQDGIADTSSMKEVVKTVKIKRERIELNPIVYKSYKHTTADGVAHTIGYIRLYEFNANSSVQMARAVEALEAEGADEYILDLRDNPGGLVDEGLNVAGLWLNGGQTVVNTIDRTGGITAFNILNEASPMTQDPMVVLVNEGTASASEIVAGALLDNGRAQVLGSKTYGKGRIQSVFDLKDGSGLFVTVAMYQTPNNNIIDKVGITPDHACSMPAAVDWQDSGIPLRLAADMCIMAAEAELDQLA
mmetsp:Transcript_32503/g.62453  ORF Transcript_32503/g.62453 Transcript_32503/m.62453 type:complete len:508 (+) Transcript_32503:305-1828(+)|eukprot:CAMPEP_0114253088 /NCGR_PEP_ID=MMETSP0058-20121206/16199_1 /TAXON_ID=36894 /ORGANISM="Pyramimonas parkeae, CCMP726" /LENGTH=507 /DNA_ID=CAMNT_0001367097 /DNA_START=273 /DNA_END=1796 /DNA_ORIENTATION=-